MQVQTSMLDQKRALEHLESLSKQYEYLILLTYSVSSTLFEKLISIGKLKDFRIMYSMMSKIRNPLVQLQRYQDKIKQVETSFALDRYERSHAKIYLFAKHVGKRIELRAVIGSFNLTYQGSIELHGDYKGEFSEGLETGNFMNLFENLPDMAHLTSNFSGDSVVLDSLALLLTHWHNEKFFVQSNDRRFVTTFGPNSLKTSLIGEIEESVKTGERFDEPLDVLIVSPFHSYEAIRNFLEEIERAMKSLRCKTQYQVRLLTNGYFFSPTSDDEAFTDPSLLRKLTRDYPFSIRFWGTPSDEPVDHGNRLHLKLFSLNVGRAHKVLVTSANLTNPGLGYVSKNLEVGVWERNNNEARRIFETITELWRSETTPDVDIWKSLEKWYRDYGGEEEPSAFSINTLPDEMHIEDEIHFEVKTDKKVAIKAILSFQKAPTETLILKKKRDIHRASFVLRRSHMGKMDFDLYAKTGDGAYYRIKHKRAKIIERFPSIKAKESLDKEKRLLRVELEIERDKALEELCATEFNFEKSEPLAIKVEKTKAKKFVEFILPIEPVRISYRNKWNYKIEAKCACASAPKPDTLLGFHQTRSVSILTDQKTICPKEPIILELEFDRRLLRRLRMKHIRATRKAEYYDYYSSTRSIERREDLLEIDNEIILDNEFHIPSRAERVLCRLYATNRRGNFLIPMGKVEYEIFRNPPEIIVEHSPIRTNITPLLTTFVLREDREIDVVEIEYGFGDYENKIELLKNEPTKIDILEKVSKNELEKGLSYNARFRFLFSVADKIIKEHLNFHFWAHPYEELLWNKKDPPNILNQRPSSSIGFTYFDQYVPTVHLQWNKLNLTLLVTDKSVRVPIPSSIISLFNKKWDIERHKCAQIIFSIEGEGKIALDVDFSYVTIEKDNYLPLMQGCCEDAIIVGPKGFNDNTSKMGEIRKIARHVFRKDLATHLPKPNLVQYEEEIIGPLIRKLRSGKYVPKYLSEAEQKIIRYNASSKYRRMADIIVVNYRINRAWHIAIRKGSK